MIADDIERFLKEFNIAPSRFGRDVFSDPKFVFELRRGRIMTAASQLKVHNHMDRIRRHLGQKPPASA